MPFLKSTLRNCEVQVVIRLFDYISQWTLRVCQLHFAKFLKSTLPNSEVQVANSTSPPWRWTAWMSLKLPTEFKILDCPRPEFFWSAENFCPWLLKKRFPMSCIYLHTPRPLPFLLSLFNLFLLDGSLKLERSPFKLRTVLTYWQKIERFPFEISCFLCILFYEWCGFEAIKMEWKSIHENSWNLWMKYNSSMKCSSFCITKSSKFHGWTSMNIQDKFSMMNE